MTCQNYATITAGKFPDISLKIRSVVIKTAGNVLCPHKISGFISIKYGFLLKISSCSHKHSWKMSQRHVRNIRFWCHEYSCKMSPNVILNTKFCHHKHGWNMSSLFGKNISCWCYKHFRKHPEFLLKIFSFLLQAQLENVPVQGSNLTFSFVACHSLSSHFLSA